MQHVRQAWRAAHCEECQANIGTSVVSWHLPVAKWRTWNSQLPVVFSIFCFWHQTFFYANQKQLCFFSIEFVSKNPRFDKHLANSPHGDLVLQPPNFRNQTDVFFSKALKNGECPSAGTWALKPSKLWRNVLLLSAPPRNESRIGWNPIRRINAHFRMLQLHTTMANWFRTMATFPKINVSHKNFIVLD